MKSLFSGCESLLVTNPINIRYLTGFVGASPEEREAYVLLTQNQTFLFTNALYREQAKTANATIIEISRGNPFAKVFKRRLLAKLQGDSLRSYRVGFEEYDLTVAEFRKLKKELRGVHLVATKNRIEELRMIKREDETENIRKAAKLADECFDVILGKMKPGVTESGIAWEIESFFRKRGAETAFSPIVAFGKNSSIPHYSSTNNSQLTTNNLILLDFGAKINGYCSDMTRVVFFGKPKDEWKKAYETVRKAQAAALDNIHNNPDGIARNIIRKSGFPVYPHSLGHGVGLAIHEQPRLSYKKRVKLRAGMVVTIEPAIYKEGSYGIRVEDLVLLTKDGIEILSTSSKKLTIL